MRLDMNRVEFLVGLMTRSDYSSSLSPHEYLPVNVAQMQTGKWRLYIEGRLFAFDHEVLTDVADSSHGMIVTAVVENNIEIFEHFLDVSEEEVNFALNLIDL